MHILYLLSQFVTHLVVIYLAALGAITIAERKRKLKMDKAALLKNRIVQSTVDLGEDVGSVTIRAMSKTEIHNINATTKDGPRKAETIEFKMLQMAVVDPELTMDEVEEWCSNSPGGETQKVLTAIMALSGMNTDEAVQKELEKEVYRSFRE